VVGCDYFGRWVLPRRFPLPRLQRLKFLGVCFETTLRLRNSTGPGRPGWILTGAVYHEPAEDFAQAGWEGRATHRLLSSEQIMPRPAMTTSGKKKPRLESLIEKVRKRGSARPHGRPLSALFGNR